VQLSSVISLVKALDLTEDRAAKVLDKKDIDKLNNLKESLVVICIYYLNFVAEPSQEDARGFFTFILKESKNIRPNLKKLVLFPPREAPVYLQRMRENEATVQEYACSIIGSNF